MKDVRSVFGVAQYELKMQARAFALWIIALLLTALAWTSVSSPYVLQSASQQNAYSLVNWVALFAGLLLLFASVPALYRDYQLRFIDLLWSRPVQAGEYVLGKFFGLVVAGHLALAVPLLASLAVGRWLNVPLDLVTGFHFLLVLAVPTVLFVTTSSLLLTLLVRRALVVYFLAIVLWLAASVLQPNLVDLGNYAVQEAYYSPVIGLGPGTDLFYANRLVYLTVAGGLLCITIVLFPFRETRSELSASRRPLLLAIALLFALGTAGSVARFQAIAAPLAGHTSPSSTTIQPPSVSIDDCRLTLTLDPFQGELSGQATIRFTSRSSEPMRAFALGLNQGLKVDEALLAETSLKVQNQDILLFDPPMAPGASKSLWIRYHGRLLYARSDYQITGVPRDEPQEIRGYVGQRAAFLLKDGGWYPFATSGAPRRLEITLPARLPVVTTADRNIQSDGWRTLAWEPADRLPIPLLAAAATYVQTPLPGGDTVYLPEGYKRVIDDIALPFVQGAKYLDRWLLDTSRPLTVVVVPLMATTAYDPQQKILFLPEDTFRQYTYTPTNSGLSFQEMYTRWAAEQIARAWWRGNQIAVETGSRRHPQSGLSTAIASYSAMLVTNDLLGEGFADREVTARQKALEAARKGTYTLHSYSWASFVPDDLFQLVHAVRAQLGDEAFRQLLRGYLAEWRGKPSPVTATAFAELVRRQRGDDITPLLNQYGVK